MMPGMSGLEFCQAIRSIPHDVYSYFILLTSKSEKADIAKGLDCGADDFLSKPVNSAELRARLRAGQRVLEMERKLRVENEKSNAAYETIKKINADIQKDLKQAEKLQRTLLPASTIETEQYRLSNLFQSSGHVGGDLVGTFALDQSRVAIYSIDVAGHGVSSALMTMRLHSLLSPSSKRDNLAFANDDTGAETILSPAELAQTLNQSMLDAGETELYFTMAYADINLATGQVKMVQAGHSHPIVCTQNQQVTLLGNGGLPIGLLPNVEFENVSFQLKSGDRLLLYSDGLSECQNDVGELLDDLGLAQIFSRCDKLYGEELLADLLWHVTEYAQGDQFDDDVSAVLFEYF